MAKFRVWVSTDNVGSEIEDEIEIPDSDLDGLSDEEADKRIWDDVQEWLWDHIDSGYKRIKKG